MEEHMRNFIYFYSLEKFRTAIDTLATGKGDVRSRLYSAYISIHAIKRGELPVELHEDFDWIVRTITKYSSRHKNEGDLQATLAQIKNSTGSKVAERILMIGKQLMDLHDDWKHQI